MHQCLSFKLALLLWSWWLQVHLQCLPCSLPLYLLQPLHFLPVGPCQPIVGFNDCKHNFNWWVHLPSTVVMGDCYCTVSIQSSNHHPHFLPQLAGFPEYIVQEKAESKWLILSVSHVWSFTTPLLQSWWLLLNSQCSLCTLSLLDCFYDHSSSILSSSIHFPQSSYTSMYDSSQHCW